MRLRKREIKIIQIIKEHPYVTSREIADYLKVSEKTVRSDINGIICDFGVSIPLSEVHAICYRSPHNPLKKSIFFKS